MREVELKARVKNEELLREKLRTLGCVLGEPFSQDDTVYVESIGSVEVFTTNKTFVRLRVLADGTVLFTLKHHEGKERAAADPTDAPVEIELAVSSREKMEEAILALGFKPAVRVKKVRRKGSYGKWEVCLDTVHGLGTFIEIEEMAELEEAPAIQEKMRAFLLSLGIAATDMPAQRYDVALIEQHQTPIC